MPPEQATALVSLMDRLSRAVRIEEIADVVVEDGGEALGADGDLELYVWGDDDAHLEHLRSRYPRSGAARRGRIPAGKRTPATYAALTGEPLWFSSRDAYLATYPDGADLVGDGEQALAVLPLSTRERTFGAVSLRWTTEREFGDDERTYQMTLCRIFAQALDRGRLVEEQRLARERAESNERRSRLLAEASALLTMSLVEDEIYRRAAEIAVPAFADWCVIDVREPDDGPMRRALVHHKDRALAAEVERLTALPPIPHESAAVERALEDGESQLVTDVTPTLADGGHDERVALREVLGLRSYIVVPFVLRGRVEGTFTFVRGERAPPFVTDDVALGEDLSHRAALAIENARLFHTERRLAQDVQRLQRISEGLTVAVSPDDVAEVVVEHGRPALGAASGVLVLYDGRRGCFRVNVGHGFHPRRPALREEYPLDPPTHLGEAIEHGEPVFLESADDWNARYPTTPPPPAHSGARVALPLRAGEKVLGALGYAFDGPRRFSNEDRGFLLAVARQCSLALERARLYAEQTKAREQTLMLLRVTSALALTQTTDEVATAVVEDVLDIVGSEGGYLGLLDPDDHVVTLRRRREQASHPLDEHEERHRLQERTPITDVVRRGQPLFFESRDAFVRAYPPKGAAPDLEASAVLAISAGGRTIGALGLRFGRARPLDEDLVQLLEAVAIQCSDAFERAELLEREAEARRGAEVANRAKDEFLAMLGHELRNPLMPIVTALSLMRIKGDEHFVKERAMIERQAQHLLRLVDDLLDVSRITRGKIDLRRRRTDVASVVRHAMETTSPLLEQRHHHVDVQLADGLYVDGDENRLVQVAANLLSNAAKYTEPGGHISVRAALERDEVVLRVRDSGVGIEPQLLPRVFDLFVQGARGIDRAQGGLGLGLSLVKSITVLHGGRVEVRSEGHGKGSEFIVRLPHAPSRDGAEVIGPAATSDLPESPARAPLRILVVDDNVDAADSLAETLQELGHETAVAYDGPEGIAKARALSPEVALLDIGLPVMDGYELARSLKKEHGDRLTLVAVTGYGQPADRARAREAGFHHHFVKPIHLAALLALLQRVGVEQHSP